MLLFEVHFDIAGFVCTMRRTADDPLRYLSDAGIYRTRFRNLADEPFLLQVMYFKSIVYTLYT